MKTLSEYIEDMLLYKESIGYSRHSYEYDLMRFNRFMVSDYEDDEALLRQLYGLS